MVKNIKCGSSSMVERQPSKLDICEFKSRLPLSRHQEVGVKLPCYCSPTKIPTGLTLRKT